MFPRVTYPVTRFMIGWRVPRVNILLVHFAKNPNSRADVAATWHSLLVTMSSLLVKLQNSNFKAQILAAFTRTRSHLADNMFPRMTSPVARFMIGRRAPRVKILLVHLAKNPYSRADVAATWHSLLVTMSSQLVTFIICGHYIRLLLYVPSRPGTNAI